MIVSTPLTCIQNTSKPKRVSLNISSRNSTTNPGSGMKYQARKNPDNSCNNIATNNMKPIIEVTLEKGNNNLLTKKFK